MRAKDAVTEVIKASGKSPIAVSREMGRADSFLSTTITRGSVPKLDTFAEICEACGLQVIVRDSNGNEAVVEP